MLPANKKSELETKSIMKKKIPSKGLLLHSRTSFSVGFFSPREKMSRQKPNEPVQLPVNHTTTLSRNLKQRSLPEVVETHSGAGGENNRLEVGKFVFTHTNTWQHCKLPILTPKQSKQNIIHNEKTSIKELSGITIFKHTELDTNTYRKKENHSHKYIVEISALRRKVNNVGRAIFFHWTNTKKKKKKEHAEKEGKNSIL